MMQCTKSTVGPDWGDRSMLPRVIPHLESLKPDELMEASARLMVQAPEKVLESVIGNLLRNALAYTDDGRVTIEIGPDFIEIEDTGPGIPETQRGRIFEMFFSTKGDKGTGLGLGVVSNVMRRCGGSVALTDGRPGSGACFQLRFPADIASTHEGGVALAQ